MCNDGIGTGEVAPHTIDLLLEMGPLVTRSVLNVSISEEQLQLGLNALTQQWHSAAIVSIGMLHLALMCLCCVQEAAQQQQKQKQA